MRPPEPPARRLERIRAAVNSAAEPQAALRAVTYEILHYHYDMLGATLTRATGGQVQTGPFAGMRLKPDRIGSLYTPKLLGCYESELHPLLRQIAAAPYRRVVNVGASEGYYAIGLARLMPGATVHAFDTDPKSAPLILELATMNGVADRIVVGGECGPDTLRGLIEPGTLIVCDIEGGERDLLDPVAVPNLSAADILVECHDFLPVPVSPVLSERFRPTHEVTLIPNAANDPNAYPLLRKLPPVQKLYAVWEGRPGPTPWLWLSARAGTGTR